jgi:gamma-glutamylcyclotransferase (GGCT)/AIG2-like uncharacterized protein YtfP
MSPAETEYLFAYGTLQNEDVQRATFGRRLEGQSDALVGYRLVMVEIADQEFVQSSGTAQHRNLQYTGRASDFVAGTAFAVSRQELEQADEYEPTDYQRVQVKLRSGTKAWVYVHSSQATSLSDPLLTP